MYYPFPFARFLRICCLILASLALSFMLPTCAVSRMCSSYILSIILTPVEKLSIFNSAAFSSSSCLLVSGTVSNPYSIVGLTTVLYHFYSAKYPITTHYTSTSSPSILISQDSLFSLSILLFIVRAVDPNYLKSVSLFQGWPNIYLPFLFPPKNNITSKHHRQWRFLSDLIQQPIRHYRKEKWIQFQFFM